MLKKSLLGLSALAMAATVFTGCSARTSSPSGEMIDVTKVDFKEVSKMKKGKSCHSNFLFIPLGTDDSTLSAAAQGGITQVAFIENSTKILITPSLYSERCKTVYGK